MPSPKSWFEGANPVPVRGRVPAVVIGADADGLGIARSLGVANVPVVVVDTDHRRPAMHSRYAQPYIAQALSGPRLIASLLELRARFDCKTVLFPTTDPQVETLSKYRERLDGAFYLRLPSQHCVCTLLHKCGFQKLAEELGFPVPRAVSLRDEKDLDELDKIRFPAVAKPGNKALFFSNHAERARKVHSRWDAEAFCLAILPRAPDLIFQEWIEGGESDIYFCLQYRGAGGVTIGSFTGRKLRCWPPQTGSTASCVAAPEVALMLELMTTSFFDKTEFVGMCSMEFKRDCRTGEFFMIEPTVCRTDWQEEVATLNGVNIPLAAYCYELGLPLPVVKSLRHAVTWTYPPSYCRSVLATGFHRVFRWPFGRLKTPCWNLRDPLPSVFFVCEWTRKLSSLNRWREFILNRFRFLKPVPINGRSNGRPNADVV